MKREFLKSTVEGITDEQISAILNEHGKEISDVNTQLDGANEKIKTLTTERDGLKDQIQKRDEDLSELRKQVEGQNDLESKLRESEEKYRKDTEELNQKLKDQEISFKRDAFFSNYKFSSKAAEAGVRSEFEKRGFVLENGEFLGGKEFMENLMADDDYKGAFVIEAPSVDDPTPPKFSQTKTPQTKQPQKMSLLEMMKSKNENPNMVFNFDE